MRMTICGIEQDSFQKNTKEKKKYFVYYNNYINDNYVESERTRNNRLGVNSEREVQEEELSNGEYGEEINT